MKRFFLFLMLGCCLTIYGSNVIVFNSTSPTITNRVTSYFTSVNTPDFVATNILVNPSIPSNFLTNRWDFYRVTNGLIVELSSGEKTTILNAESAAIAAALAAHQTSAKSNATNIVENFDEDGRILRALAEVIMDELNIIRTNMVPALVARNMTQLKTAIKNKLAAQPNSAP